MVTHHWPFFSLRVTTPRLELRYPDDELLEAVVELAAAGIHDPGTMPFLVPWTRQAEGVLQRESFRHFWATRAATSVDQWSFPFAVLVDGEVVGVQDIKATRFPVTRTFETGSWIGLAHQGRGIGKEMRAAVLHLAFEGLGAELAETGCWEDNPRSRAVTAALGYLPNGWSYLDREGTRTRMLRFHLPRDRWQRRDDIEIRGLEACLPLLGLS